MAHKKIKDMQTMRYLQAHTAIFGTVILVFLILYIFVPQLSQLQESVTAMKGANLTYVIAAVVSFCLGFPILAFKYVKISILKLSYWLTLKVQIGGAFVSKLLPQSIGSLTVNTFYLTAVGHTIEQSASVMALNAITSSIGFGAIVITALIIGGTNNFGDVSHSGVDLLTLLLVVLAIVIILWVVLYFATAIRKRIAHFITGLLTSFSTYKDHPSKPIWGIIGNAAGSMTGIVALYFCGHAVGLPITLPQVVIAYTFGSIAGNLVPTPGGLGGAEAGLYAGFVLAGYDQSASLAAVLIYRLITYWLPIIPGYLVFRNLRKTTFKNFSIWSAKKPA